MKTIKLGHQAPINWRVNKFNSIEIEGDLAYCKSHNFVYNTEDEKEKLYYAKPCFYTDNRYEESVFNFYKNTKIRWNRKKEFSLKTCIRTALKIKNVPKGTIIEFKKSWYYRNKNIDNSFNFKVKKENSFDPNYQINLPEYSNNFKDCEFSKILTDLLRSNGFIVKVYNSNPHTLIGEEEGEIAIAHGYGKQIGYSSKNNTFRGYSNGIDNILYDRLGEFDKWSRCNEILKTTDIQEILNILKS